MVRRYERKTDHQNAERAIRVRFERREQIDADKVAEVLIRLTLRAADGEAARTGDYLRHLLAPKR
ncbi:MAG: hypothetical protein QM638_05940 [Nocardioides sp.]|uniref:hypothetical protein n=1 Tax=Nocardioides sp. TaxID=35761 RepID=UPI0039E2AD96